MSKYTNDLDAGLDIHNEHDIARRYECPVISYSTTHKHAFGRWDYRATAVMYIDGRARYKEFRERPTNRNDTRRACVEAAQNWVNEHFDTSEWEPTGLPNSWIPKEVKVRLRADLAAWRKEQRAAAKGDAR